MSDLRGALRTDPHSHHDVPREREAVRAPSLTLCESDGTVTDVGALFYAYQAYRERWRDDEQEGTYADLDEARRCLGSMYFWCIVHGAGILR